MIVGAIIFAVIIFPILWVVFAPVNIMVNTARKLYEIKQVGTISMSLRPGETPFVRVRVLGFLVDTKKKVRSQQMTPGKRRRSARTGKARKSISAWIELFSRIVRSFQCKRLVWNIDFDDVVVNAQLFPVGYFISRGPLAINVNFERKNLLDIWIRARVHRMLWAFIRFYLTK